MTQDGVELPVIDVTHPAFQVKASEAELERLFERLVRAHKSGRKMPAIVQKLLFRLFLGRSILARGLEGATGTYLDGLSTYLFKLGPDNLWRGAAKIDRKIAASLPALSVRLRMEHVARLTAEGVRPALAARPGRPLHLLNLGGGPAVDSLNALILLRRENPEGLAGRRLAIHVLDRDPEGPAFGARALAALRADGAPLAGLEVDFRTLAYDWADTAPLAELLAALSAEEPVVAVSSEGALFEYASDEEIAANLDCIRHGAPPDTVLAGTLSRVDGPRGAISRSTRVAVRRREWDAFEALCRNAGWTVDRILDAPFSHDFRLVHTLDS